MRRRTAFVAAIGFLGLIALVWMWGHDRGAEPAADTAADAVSAPGAPVHAGDEDEAAAPPARDTGGVAVLQDDDPEGSLRLEGQVIDEGQLPAAGAVVTVSSNPPRSTTSGEDGTFHFDELVGRPYRLVARHPDGVAGPVTARLTDTSDPVILRLRPGATVEVTVVDEGDDSPIAGATVELRDVDVQTATTGADGIARITGVVPDFYGLVARAPGHAVEHDWLRVPAGAETTTARLGLGRGAPVAGLVLDPDGDPVAGARVLYSGASEWAQQADPRHDAVVTDADGAFRFEGLPAGSFRFVARHDTFAPGTSELVTLDGETERTGVEVRLEPGAVLSGRVIDQGAAPVPSARVRVAEADGGFRGGRTRQTYTGEDGGFEMTGLPRAELSVVALSDEASSQIVGVDVSQSPARAEVELVLDVDGTISGVVENPDGDPIDGAQVRAFPDVGSADRDDFDPAAFRLRGFPSELTDPGGNFTLRGLESGSYRIAATPPGRAGGGRFGFRRRGRDAVAAETGDTDVVVVLEPDGGVEGKVAFAGGDAPDLFTISTGFRGGTPFSSEDGAFVLDSLPPGDYELTVRGPGFDARRVEAEIEPGAITDVGTITVTRGRRISGRVVGPDGQPVEGATVRGGSMVFGDGSSTEARFGGGPMSANVKETTTDASGQFSLSGVGTGDRTLVAEEESIGRSRALRVRGGAESVTAIELALEPYGALEGVVTRGGQPVGEVRVSVQSQTAPDVIFGVATGDDGTFRFDRLAPDVYKASVVGGMPMRGMGFHSQTVTVQSGQTARVELSVETGDVTLTVTPVPQNADQLGFATMHLVEGSIDAETSRELDLKTAALEGYSSFSFAMGGRPVQFEELVPGPYTACAVPYPQLGSPQEYMAYGEDHGDDLPAFCRPVSVEPTPAEQSIDIPVQIPDKVGDDGTEG